MDNVNLFSLFREKYSILKLPNHFENDQKLWSLTTNFKESEWFEPGECCESARIMGHYVLHRGANLACSFWIEIHMSRSRSRPSVWSSERLQAKVIARFFPRIHSAELCDPSSERWIQGSRRLGDEADQQVIRLWLNYLLGMTESAERMENHKFIGHNLRPLLVRPDRLCRKRPLSFESFHNVYSMDKPLSITHHYLLVLLC